MFDNMIFINPNYETIFQWNIFPSEAKYGVKQKLNHYQASFLLMDVIWNDPCRLRLIFYSEMSYTLSRLHSHKYHDISFNSQQQKGSFQ